MTAFDNPARSASSTTVDATNAWNSVCFQFHFIPKPFDPSVTFGRGYFGSDFNADLAGIKAAVNQLCGVESPTTGSDVMGVELPTTGSDVMKATIENWGQYI